MFKLFLLASIYIFAVSENDKAQIAGIQFKVIQNGDSDRRYIWLHGDEQTARMALENHMKRYKGKAFLVQGILRESEFFGGIIDPNRIFSSDGAQANIQKYNPRWSKTKKKSKIIKNYRINEDKINVINRGIDTDFYNPEVYDQSQFIQFLSKYNIPSDKRIILYPGRLTEWKGQLNFLEVLKNFRDNNIFCFFVFISNSLLTELSICKPISILSCIIFANILISLIIILNPWPARGCIL